MNFNIFTCLLGLSFFLWPSCSAQSVRFIEMDGQVKLIDHDRHIFSYQIETKSENGQYPRANYIHPLNDFSGDPLTEDFPEDHLHQRGIFWAWHQLYRNGVSVSDPWVCSDIIWEVYDVKHEIKQGQALLKSTVDWLIGENQEKLVRENLEVVYNSFENYFTLDFNIDLQALRDNLEIGGSDDNKGYGGFSARLALGDAVTFSNASGEVKPDNEQVQAGNWIVVSDIGESQSDVAIMYHPESSASLKGWILRKSGSMQNPVWPGRQRAVLHNGDHVIIKATLAVFRDKTKTEEIDKIYQDYVNQ